MPSLAAVDRACAWLLLVGAALHSYGALTLHPVGSEIQVWALSGSLAAALTAVLNLVRAQRPLDITLAWITFTASLGWVAVALGFGVSIGHLVDLRVIWHAVAAAMLAAFSLRSIRSQRTVHQT